MKGTALVRSDIASIMCDQFKVEIGPGKLWEVLHLSEGKFNMFSIS